MSLETKQCLKRLGRVEECKVAVTPTTVKIHAKEHAKAGSLIAALIVKAEHKNVLDVKQVAKLAKHVNLHVKEIINVALV